MILCPNCGAKLPPRANTCNFCQESIDPVLATPVGGVKYGPAPWVVTAYYTVAGYFMVNGAVQAIQGAVQMVSPAKHSLAIFGIFGIIIGVLTILLGLGLALKIEFVRGIANFVCGIKIILGLLSAPSMIVVCMAFGPWGAIMLFMRALDLALAGFMIYLIGETDRLVPQR